MTLFDPLSLAIVFGGSLLATLIQCGPRACRRALRVLSELPARRFDPERARAELARQVGDIARDGLIRSRPVAIGDAEFDEATGAMIHHRSLDALLEHHAAHRARRMARAGEARAVVGRLVELAPVLGLAGTLLSLSTLADPHAARAGLAQAIGMAVLTTFYGLVLANFIAAPLAAWIDRRAASEDTAREELFAWLTAEVARADPHVTYHPAGRAA